MKYLLKRKNHRLNNYISYFKCYTNRDDSIKIEWSPIEVISPLSLYKIRNIKCHLERNIIYTSSSFYIVPFLQK